jgi:hypothetical protein
MTESKRPITIRLYERTDYEEVVALFTRINRELAPANMRELFEQYIATSISGELRELSSADAMSTRTVGGGLKRFHFEKVL